MTVRLEVAPAGAAVVERPRVQVMGIVNVTPDSFSDGGRYYEVKQALQHAYRLLEAGADILDIGGESTRPGHTPVDADEEWRRIEPVLRELAQRTDATLSVDTYKSVTAQRALDVGVHIINDVWGGLADDNMLPTVAAAGCTYIWMHNRREPATADPFAALLTDTERGVERCLEAGIRPEKLWLDPGIGFGKTYEHNLSVLRRLPEYCRLGYPVLLGTSRKRFIGRTLDKDVDGRLVGSLATVSWGVMAGVRAVRVHDVAETVETCRMLEAILAAE
ncbi:dihydropteroate synthase [Alicyclobacillus shizuokensis]|uniref:dihydropteroate synthase n=1 Tax=Alicyclobacillus shizuokensis TaxID=392014 RepID=UPI0008368E1A|nr:dihydropteroate synthase [Alicyclobacillus shizuokensis]MCL6626950.1 dihydropteroate synthase [Alicyclobacillus shizuokensis]